MLLSNIDKLVRTETVKAIRELLEGNLSSEQDDSERERQRQQASDARTRGIVADADKSQKTDEAEEETSEKKAAPSEEESTNSTEDENEKQQDRTGGKGTADSPKLRTPKRNTLEDPTVGSLIDKLNAMRGGKSLKDPGVKKSFTQYFEGLTTSERQSLLVFLTGIAQILAGTEAGAAAIDPGDVGLRVKGDVDKSKEVDPEKKEKKPTGREGTAENPIVVGESPDKSRILRALREYRKHDGQ